MTDATGTDLPPTDRIEQVDLQLEMQRSYLDYAMSVIVGRALPDVRDGLKPVHRRVIYAMYDGGYRPDRAFSKCTRIIGDVMGQFHPHGDSSVYDALVRLVQPWALRYPLALGQGNFSSPGNDGAAAHRYTETKMAPLAMEMVRDIDEDTVDFQDNYDGRTLVARRSEVALALRERVAQRPRLHESHERVVHRRVAVRVELAHHVADDAGALAERAVGTVAAVVHRVDHAAVHGLEPVAHVGQRARRDDAERVV